MPVDLVRQGRVETLGNEQFKRAVRCAILGENDPDAPTFEETIRRMIDCRRLGFADGAQALNYVTSHDVEGFRNERLYEFLGNNGVVRTEERIKLIGSAWIREMGVLAAPADLAGGRHVSSLVGEAGLAAAERLGPRRSRRYAHRPMTARSCRRYGGVASA